MSDETMKIGIDLDVKSVGEELVDALVRKLKTLERQIKSINATANAVSSSISGSSSGGSTSPTRRTNDTKAARDALALDRAAIAELRRKMGLQSRMAAQRLKKERDAFTSDMRQMKEKASEEAKAFRQRMTFATNMGRMAVSEERNAARERARSVAESTRAETRRSREIAAAIRSNASLEIAESRRVDRERAANRRALRSSGRDVAHHGGDAYQRLTRPPAVAAIATGAATAALARKALSAESDLDSAEINSRIYAGLSKDAARALRDQWASPLAEALGVSTAKLLTSFTDAVKLGIPAEGAKSFSALATQTSEAWSVPFETVTDVLGTVNSLLTSTGEAFSFDKIKSVANTVQHLAAKQSTTPEKLISFLKKGAGASQVLGMSQEAGLAFGSASTSLGNEAGQSGRMFDYVSSRLIELPNLVKKQGDEGRQAKELVRALGYSSAESMNAQRRSNPDAFMPEFMDRFSKIKDSRKQEQMIRFFTGREWLGEFGRMVKGIETYKEASKLAREAKGLDAIGAVWELHRTKLAFVFKQFKAGWLNILGEFGKVLSPIARQVGDSFLSWSRTLQGGGLRARFQAVIDGFVAGLGFRDVPAMLQGAFGTPGAGDGGAISAWKASARAFAEGIKDIFGAVKSVISAFVGGDPEVIARWSGRILALSVALAALSPVLAVLGGLAALVQTLAAGLAGVAALKSLAGGAAVAGGGSALLMAAGGIIAAGFLAKIANAYGILKPLDTSKGIGRGIVEFLDPGLASRLFGEEKPKGNGAWVAPPVKKPIEKLTEALETNAKVIKQSFDSPVSGLGGLIHKAALMSGTTGMGSTILALRSGPSLGGSSGEGLTATSGPYGNSTPGSALDGSGSSRMGMGSISGRRDYGASGGAATAPMLKGQAGANARKAYDFFRAKGLSHEAASGILGNMKHESNFNPGARGDGGAAHGLFQHHADRRAAILKGSGVNMSTDSFDRQLDGTWWEMNHGDAGARKALKILQTPGITSGQAGHAFGKHFERPAARHLQWRGRSGEEMAAAMTPGGGTTQAGAPGPGGAGQYDGLRLKGGQAIAGGASYAGVSDLARQIQADLPGGVKHFGAFNDRYHQGTRSKHANGLAFDTTLIDAAKSGEAAQAIRDKLKAAGLDAGSYKVIDEYKNPSPRSTGGHLHTQFNSAEAAKKYSDHLTRKAEEIKSSGWKPGLGSNAPVSGGAGASLGRDVTPRVSNTQPIGGKATGSNGGGSGGGGSGQIAININGANGNPEELANAVQRKLSESMNRRTHDISPTSI